MYHREQPPSVEGKVDRSSAIATVRKQGSAPHDSATHEHRPLRVSSLHLFNLYGIYFLLKRSYTLVRMSSTPALPPFVRPPPQCEMCSSERFLSRFIRRVDDNTRAYFAHIITPRWFGFRMDAITLIVLTASCFASVAANEHSQTTGKVRTMRTLVFCCLVLGCCAWLESSKWTLRLERTNP